MTTNDATLDNGLRVVALEQSDAPVATCALWVPVGARNETPRTSGYTHAMEHILFKGTERFPSGEIMGRESDFSGAYTNGHTGPEASYFTLQVEHDRFPQMLSILADMMHAPLFPPRALETEKEAIINEMNAAHDNPQMRIIHASRRNTFAGHPIAQDIFGTPETVRSATADALRAYHTEYYRPERAMLILHSALPHKEAHALAQKQFNRWKEKGTDAPDTTPTAPATAQQPKPYTFLRADNRQTYIAIDFPTPGAGDVMTTAGLEVLSAWLGYGVSGILKHALRSEHGLVYTLNAGAELYSDVGRLRIITATDRPKEVMQRIMALLGTLPERLMRAEFDERKAQTARIVTRINATPLNAVNVIGRFFVTRGAPVSPAAFNAQIHALSYEHFLRTVTEYITPKNAIITVLGKEDPHAAMQDVLTSNEEKQNVH